jgi:acid phosphatase (class A)
MVVPIDFGATFNKSLAEGLSDATSFQKEHKPSEVGLVKGWALLKMKWPPKTEQEKEELAYLHQIATQRTPEQNATAEFYSENGITEAWEYYLKDYTSHVGPAQAKAATKLLHDSMNMVNEITQTAKAAAGRDRPFVVDPSLPLMLEKPGNSPSYPSGHSSGAVAGAMVLAHLMPDRKKEFMDMALQAGWARVYGGVHFPSDVMSGVKIAATVTGYLCATSHVTPKKGTAAAAAHKRAA